jgi:hypothetical protein
VILELVTNIAVAWLATCELQIPVRRLRIRCPPSWLCQSCGVTRSRSLLCRMIRDVQWREVRARGGDAHEFLELTGFRQ